VASVCFLIWANTEYKYGLITSNNVKSTEIPYLARPLISDEQASLNKGIP
jgi:hypothetical protein